MNCESVTIEFLELVYDTLLGIKAAEPAHLRTLLKLLVHWVVQLEALALPPVEARVYVLVQETVGNSLALVLEQVMAELMADEKGELYFIIFAKLKALTAYEKCLISAQKKSYIIMINQFYL